MPRWLQVHDNKTSLALGLSRAHSKQTRSGITAPLALGPTDKERTAVRLPVESILGEAVDP